MSIEIQVDKRFARWVDKRRLNRVASRALRIERSGRKRNATVVITDDRSIRQYNLQYHHVNSPTDVLSFGSDEPDYLGDILISYETARENARAARWRLGDELELLLVHGLLHLIGYDDRTAPQRGRMWDRQAEILKKKIKS